MAQDWKDKLGMAFSISPDSQNENKEEKQEKTPSIPANKQTLYVELDKKGRNGKSATLVTGFEGTDDELKELARRLKTQCGVGGSTRDGEILIQGNFRDKVIQMLQAEGYKTKRIGG
ncbi:translation initiation factor [Mangrovibacterium diazotrophicum]|uniref:Translation initiation factor 1 (eIF-1/SUI1) n=1 Tax=Mangrovibacterium diazotrophicum TaxID=1261403 RepID=A0A419W748_9BACT|nr:translation initiation factor [Mangrovibacterium diazotrophicum]RKD91288.1 translation initiation factor 1 (eIF-1/SUI1) [Mangrovibacterium diazotrophicum]